jgi:hypothetical protein
MIPTVSVTRIRAADPWLEGARPWEAVRHVLVHRAASWVGEKLTKPVMLAILAEANSLLRDAECRYGRQLSRWEFRVWEPDAIPYTRTVQLIAVDPHGIGHDIEALAKGEDAAADRWTW